MKSFGAVPKGSTNALLRTLRREDSVWLFCLHTLGRFYFATNSARNKEAAEFSSSEQSCLDGVLFTPPRSIGASAPLPKTFLKHSARGRIFFRAAFCFFKLKPLFIGQEANTVAVVRISESGVDYSTSEDYRLMPLKRGAAAFFGPFWPSRFSFLTCQDPR